MGVAACICDFNWTSRLASIRVDAMALVWVVLAWDPVRGPDAPHRGWAEWGTWTSRRGAERFMRWAMAQGWWVSLLPPEPWYP